MFMIPYTIVCSVGSYCVVGLPGLMVFLFCVLTYIVYRYATNLPPDRFYGDVNNSEDM